VFIVFCIKHLPLDQINKHLIYPLVSKSKSCLWFI